MDPHDYPGDHTGDEIGLLTFLAMLLAATLALCIVLLTIADLAQIGSDVGEMVVFDPDDGTRVWMQPGIPAAYASPADWSTTRSEHLCTLVPSVMAEAGGSLIVEAKQTMRPPLFRVHWSGPRTDAGTGDCGDNVDLVITLQQLRALEIVARANGLAHGRGMF
jgi:hypothetical protein